MNYLTAAEAAKLSEEAIAVEPTRELTEHEAARLTDILKAVQQREVLLKRTMFLPVTSLSLPLKREIEKLGYRFEAGTGKPPYAGDTHLVW